LARLLRRYALHTGSNARSTAADSGTVVRLSTARAFASLQDANAFDLYKILGISSRASLPEIKVAFRKLAKALHPDRNRGDRTAETQFAAVHEAYTILSNAELRAIYDREFARICGGTEIEQATQNGGSVEGRHRRIWHEVAKTTAKTAAATVVLTACFSIGISLWQSSSGLQRNLAAVSDPAPLKAPSISSEELASALFGSQASLYADAPSEKVAANGSTAANSEPATPMVKAVATSSKPAVAGSEAMAASIEAVASSNETAVSNVPAAVIEPAPAPLAAPAEAAIAVQTSPTANEPAAPSASSKGQAARAQAERLIGLGERHLADGNIAIARQFFARAFDLGLAQAAIRLAETFEPQGLARLGAHGVKPDPAEAEKWRRRASELGQ
jgi:curved DNA-binding protein CbpA